VQLACFAVLHLHVQLPLLLPLSAFCRCSLLLLSVSPAGGIYDPHSWRDLLCCTHICRLAIVTICSICCC
jgi:hypothetical protein